MFDRLLGENALPALERTIQFAAARQRVIANNIANAETPGFRPADVSVEDFQRRLRDAFEARDAQTSAGKAATAGFESSDEVRFLDGAVELAPTPMDDSLLYHDGNDRSLERILQAMAENLLTFRVAADLLRHQFGSLDAAIRERP